MIDFRVLGPIAVSCDGLPVTIGARMVRQLLALLLCRLGRPVPIDELIDGLWPQGPPASARRTLYVYVRRLREALGTGQLIHGNVGYSIDVDESRLDALRFAELSDRARQLRRSGSLDVARDVFCSAAQLRRGRPYADVAPGPIVAQEIGRLTDLWLVTQEERIAVDLDLGLCAMPLSELNELIGSHPYHENLRAQHMLALYRSGRTGEALEAFRRTRATFAEGLGIEPGPILQELHTAFLHGDAPQVDALARTVSRRAGAGAGAAEAPAMAGSGDARRDRPVPGQLPAAVSGFTGRESALTRLDELLVVQSPTSSVPVVAVVGPAGVGKTALAVHWAHKNIGRFPDGQLYVNLRGYDSYETTTAGHALTGFLRALGITKEQLPADIDQAAALYRSLLAGRRTLVVLDNAGSVDQVRPLLPGGPGCGVLVTSRDRLLGLAVRDGATELSLGPLSLPEATMLVARLVGRERAAAEPASTAALAEACGRLPLALRISAVQLGLNPARTIEEHVAALTGQDRLAALTVDDDEQSSVRTVLDQSYVRLPPELRRAFRLLSAVPGPSFAVDGAAALLGTSPPTADRLLDSLAACHLLEARSGRYGFHDLVLEYARARAAADESAAALTDAVGRLIGHYTAHTDAAARLLYPHIVRLPSSGRDPQPAIFLDRGTALEWLDQEQPNLVAAALRASDLGHPRATWELVDAIRVFLWSHRSIDLIPLAKAAIRVAGEHGGHRERAAAHLSLGVGYTAFGHYRQAVDAYLAALDESRDAGWVEGQAASLANAGSLHLELGELSRAATDFAGAIDLYRRLGAAALVGVHLGHLAVIRLKAGQLREAAAQLAEADAILTSQGDPFTRCFVLASLGETCRHLGRYAEASAHLAAALELAQVARRADHEAFSFGQLAAVRAATGEAAEAAELATRAVTLAERVGDRVIHADVLVIRADIQGRLGDVDTALALCAKAVDVARQAGSTYSEVQATLAAAAILRQIGRPDDALTAAQTALAKTREHEFRHLEGCAHTECAACCLTGHRVREALKHAQQALALHRATGHRAGEARTLRIVDEANARTAAPLAAEDAPVPTVAARPDPVTTTRNGSAP